MSEKEKIENAMNRLLIENLLLRLNALITLTSFAIFVVYMLFAKVYDIKAAILALALIVQNLIVIIFKEVNS